MKLHLCLSRIGAADLGEWGKGGWHCVPDFLWSYMVTLPILDIYTNRNLSQGQVSAANLNNIYGSAHGAQ